MIAKESYKHLTTTLQFCKQRKAQRFGGDPIGFIAAVIVCAATISQAAAVGWTAAGATGYSTYDMFVIGKNGVSGVDQIKAIVEAGGLEAASEHAFAEGTLNNGAAVQMANVSPYSITWSGSGTDTYMGFIFVPDAAGEFASYTATAGIRMNNDSTGKTFGFANQTANYTANKFERRGPSLRLAYFALRLNRPSPPRVICAKVIS